MRILHVLSQRPGRTGSGITLQALLDGARRAGHAQAAVLGLPAEEPLLESPALAGLEIHSVRFGRPPLDFALPGMSDVMPYPSTRFSSLSPAQIETYRGAFREALEEAKTRFRPTHVHSHHVWLVSAMLKDVFGDLPISTHCHATGLRQMELCPHLAKDVRAGVRRNDAFCVLHQGHAEALRDQLEVEADRIHVVGAGYRTELFHATERSAGEGQILYAGKLSAAKGLPWLLDAVRELDDVTLHIAGSGGGEEADALRARIESQPGVVHHGRLEQDELADLMRKVSVFVLPSMYEGLPLVLVEAAACGCRLVATDLPGVRELAPRLGASLHQVPMPRLIDVDRPDPRDIDRFVHALQDALREATAAGARPLAAEQLADLGWNAVYDRVESVWSGLGA